MRKIEEEKNIEREVVSAALSLVPVSEVLRFSSGSPSFSFDSVSSPNIKTNKNKNLGTSLEVQAVKTDSALPLQGVRVPSLVWNEDPACRMVWPEQI